MAAFAIAIVASYMALAMLSLRTLTPPTPPPPTPYTRDSIRFLTRGMSSPAQRAVFVAIWAWHGFVSLTQPTPPALLCPRPALLSSSVMAGSAFSVVCGVLLLVACVSRLLAYVQLGSAFTFRLAPPTTLVTNGLYRYVRHPSYTAIFVIVLVNVLYLLNRHAVLACWLPQSWVSVGGVAVDVLWAAIVASIIAWSIYIRVRDEEEMMRRTFGPEWEAYAKRTKRYLPGLF